MDKELERRALQAIGEQVFPSCVIGTLRSNGSREIVAIGTIDGSLSVRKDTIYDVASITKSIPTASLALLFAAFNPPRFHLGGEVVEYLPELHNDYGATVEDLLRYRVRGARMSHLRDKTPDKIIEYVFMRGFDGPPGQPAYTNLPAFLLGLILERVGSDSLDHLAQKYFFDPLEMTHTTFFLCDPAPHNSADRQSCVGDMQTIAPTEIMGGKEIRGIVHDESARIFARSHRAVGHAGLFSTAPDLLNFLEALLSGNYGFTKPVLSGAQRGLGWQVNEPWMGKRRSEKTFGKTGFTGTSIVCDIERGIGFVILSNRTYPNRQPDTSAINAFRKDIADIVFD